MEKGIKKIKKTSGLDINEKMDIAYVGICPTTNLTIGIDVDDNITAHYDIKKKEVTGFTIIHWNRFRQRLYLKEKAKESVKAINDYILKHYSTITLPISVVFPKREYL